MVTCPGVQGMYVLKQDNRDKMLEKTNTKEKGWYLTDQDIQSSTIQERILIHCTFPPGGWVLHNERTDKLILQELTVLKEKISRAAPYKMQETALT